MQPTPLSRVWTVPFLCLALSGSAQAQTTEQGQSAPGGYPGVYTRVPGIYITPVANAPFTADEHIVSHQKTASGTERVLQTTTHVARASSGLTYTERRSLLPASSTADARFIEGQLYDPATHRSTLYDPQTRIARMTTLAHPRPLSPGPTTPSTHPRPGVVETSLGSQTLDGLELQGLRRIRTIPAQASGTGQDVQTTDDFWYSPALSLYVILRHDDPRTGEQLLALSHIERSEPDTTRFRVPEIYKLVDETPAPTTNP